MYNYNTLENTSINILYQTFLSSFSDYQVKFNISLSDFESLLIRRGYTPKFSIGAFKNDELVGFIYNGLRIWKGKKTIYDTGTGVIKNYRKQGITTLMFNYLIKDLVKTDVECYLLEVLKSNISAFNLYKNQGFEIVRELECFKMMKSKYKISSKVNTESKYALTDEEWSQIIEFWDIKPSWQNSIDSIKSAINNFIFLLVKDKSNIIGYGIIDKNTGDIPQFAVHHKYRNKGIGTSIVTNLIKNTQSDTISILNIDKSYTPIIKMLLSLGFENFVGQYEMLLNLK
jgi:ribosomal protein S18 acetylase RimI-like enzyme